MFGERACASRFGYLIVAMGLKAGKHQVLVLLSVLLLCTYTVHSSFSVNNNLIQYLGKESPSKVSVKKCKLRTWRTFLKSLEVLEGNVLKLTCLYWTLPYPSFFLIVFEFWRDKGWKQFTTNWPCSKSTLVKVIILSVWSLFALPELPQWNCERRALLWNSLQRIWCYSLWNKSTGCSLSFHECTYLILTYLRLPAGCNVWYLCFLLAVSSPLK